jgi:hypothetical protein
MNMLQNEMDELKKLLMENLSVDDEFNVVLFHHFLNPLRYFIRNLVPGDRTYTFLLFILFIFFVFDTLFFRILRNINYSNWSFIFSFIHEHVS